MEPTTMGLKSLFLTNLFIKQVINKAVITAQFQCSHQRWLTCPTDWADHPADPHSDHQTLSVPFSNLLLPVWNHRPGN